MPKSASNAGSPAKAAAHDSSRKKRKVDENGGEGNTRDSESAVSPRKKGKTEEGRSVRMLCWNLGGARALVKKVNLKDWITQQAPDVLAVQETKLQQKDCDAVFPADVRGDLKHVFFNSSTAKKGYSGTAILSKEKPEQVRYGLGLWSSEDKDTEGRVMVATFPDYQLVNCYTPNSGAKLDRLDFRVSEWDRDFRGMIKELQGEGKPVVVAGDLNCAHHDIDIHSPKTNQRTSGFTAEEKSSFQELLDECGLVDSFRHFHPEEVKYSYYSFRFNCRAKGKGWRLDYFLVDKTNVSRVTRSDIFGKDEGAALGSDHIPLLLELSL